MLLVKTNVHVKLENLSITKKLEKIFKRFRIYIKKNPKLNRLIINVGKLCNIVSVFSKNLFEKICHNIEYLIKLFIDYTNFIGIYIIDFIIESPTSIIDVIIYSDQLTRCELGRIFCLICIIFNTIRIIFSINRLPCDTFYCPNYTRGYHIQKRILQRLRVYLILNILVCLYFTAQTADLRLVKKKTNVLIYKQQAFIYFLLAIFWYNLAYKVWFFKQNILSNDYFFQIISVEKFKKNLKYVFAERYNNRKYNQSVNKNYGNINILKIVKTAGKKDIIIRMRFLNVPGNNISSKYSIFNKNKKWEKMDFQYFKKIIKSINKYRLNPKFLSIFWGTQCKLRKNWFNTDIVLLNWNLFLILVILSLTIIELFLENSKKRKNSEKVSNSS